MTYQKGRTTIGEILERCRHRPELFSRLLFQFAGTPQLPPEIDRFVREEPDRVRNLGFFPGGLADVFARSDVLLMPSLYESLGFTAVEAIRQGVPVIASDVSGLREVVRAGETGWLAPPRDADAFVRALENCLAQKTQDPSGWNAMLARCRDSFQRRFGPEVLQAQFERFVEWLSAVCSSATGTTQR
jgi:glycosyltransferase involved in cell wall biosynthesis